MAMGGVEGIVSANNQATMARSQAEQQEAAASREQWEAEREADMIRDQSEQRTDQLRREQEKKRARRMNAMGASGVQLSGSALLIQEGSVYDDELDAQALLDQGEMQATYRAAGGAMRADALRSQAAATRNAASSTMTRGLLSAGSNLLNGLGGLYAKSSGGGAYGGQSSSMVPSADDISARMAANIRY